MGGRREALARIVRSGAGLGAALGTTGWGLAGCSLEPDVDHADPDAPQAAPLPQRPRVVWVFSSGGPRGFVHVGVLKALHELGLKPDAVVGASIGAVVSVLYASGVQPPEIERLALELQPVAMARLAFGAAERLSGHPIAEWVRRHARAPLLEQLALPAVCVAQRQGDGAVVGFSRGDVGVAAQAAAAVEGQFAPVRIRGVRYVDADSRQPLPVRLARSLGAQRVLAVDASAHEDRAPQAAERYRAGDLRKRANTRPDAEAADLVIHPDFGYWVNLSQQFRERAIAAGYRETLAQAARLRALHGV